MISFIITCYYLGKSWSIHQTFYTEESAYINVQGDRHTYDFWYHVCQGEAIFLFFKNYCHNLLWFIKFMSPYLLSEALNNFMTTGSIRNPQDQEQI